MGVEFNASKFLSELRAFGASIESGIDQIAADATNVADKAIQDNLFASVYGTVPGRIYVRTGDLKSSAHTGASNMSNQSMISIRLGSDLGYASDIEYGRGQLKLTEGMIKDLSEAVGGDGVYLGRSGQQYMTPGPFIIPAAIKTRITIEKAFDGLVSRSWR